MLQRELWEERAVASRDKVMEAGVEFNEIADKTAFQDAMKPVYDTYLADNPDIVPLVELIGMPVAFALGMAAVSAFLV